MWTRMGPEERARFLRDAAAVGRWMTDAIVRTVSRRALVAGEVLGPCALTHSSLWDSIAFLACKCSDTRADHYVLQVDPDSSDSLKMIQSARNTEEQNLEAYMKNGHVFFRAMRDISENTELLAWYGIDLTRVLGLGELQTNTKGLICCECKQSFIFEFPLLAHQRFFCTHKQSVLTKYPEIQKRSSKPCTDFHNLARELENSRRSDLDEKTSKRRHSLESGTEESDEESSSFDTKTEEKVQTKRLRLNRHFRSPSADPLPNEGRESPANPTTDTKTSIESKPLPSEDNLGIHNKQPEASPDKSTPESAFRLPLRIMPRLPLFISPGVTKDLISTISHPLLPLNLQRSAFIHKPVPKTLLPGTSVGKITQIPQPLPSLLPASVASLGLPMQNWCAKCNVSFHMTSDLVQHMRSHHKRPLPGETQAKRREEKLKCPVCNEGFRERHHLSRHMTSHA